MRLLRLLPSKVKQLVLGDLVRRNPLFYNSALRLFDCLEKASLEERQQFTLNRLGKVLKAALSTRYGQMLGLDKSSDVRD